MGCDIHLFAEKRVNGKWHSLDKFTTNKDFDPDDELGDREIEVLREDRFYTGGRNYNLFSALAGVRSYEFRNKPNIISIPRGVPNDCCEEIKREIDYYGSDGHNHSFLYLYDLEAFNWSDYGETCNDFLLEVIPKMIATGSSDEDVRIVFYFDN